MKPNANNFLPLSESIFPLIPSGSWFQPPSPGQLHHHVLAKRRAKQYFSITTLPHPYASWMPLTANAQMETRTCHSSKSRIHKLLCGHTVAVPRDAEQCAANCVGMNNALDPIEALRINAAVKRNRENTFAGFNAWVDNVASTGDVRALDRCRVFKEVFDGMQVRHLQHKPAFEMGGFACHICHHPARRPTVPAYPLKDAPYFCIVVTKDQDDLAVIRELFKYGRTVLRRGAMSWRRRSCRSLSGPRHVQDGRITRARAREKQKVLSNVMEDILINEWEQALTL